MSTSYDSLGSVLEAINEIKKTGFTHDLVDAGFYLGGDLGVDSREMLEIWYELEQRLGIQVKDEEKRDLYTLGDVIAIVDAKVGARAGVA
ncbi:MAG: hypothetical protein WAZ48_04755 [Lysobacteraceae bacterium]